MTAILRITLAWWNTSLSPLGKARATASNFTVIENVFDHLLNSLEVDFCALGEVSESDVSGIRRHLSNSNYEVVSGITSVGRSSYSTCFVFNREKLNFQLGPNQLVLQEKLKFKLAQTIYLTPCHSPDLFQIFVSHWPSRQNPATQDPILNVLGDRLRQRVDQVFEQDERSNVIMMGDYNDEPFDKSLSYYLRATRDKDLVKKKSTLLYNPFWRHLCHPEIESIHSLERAKPESWGSYYHKAGQLFRWRTFDQMIFSSSFLGDGNWYLNEARTSIVDFEPYTQLVLSREESFDHLPIIATLERKKNG